MGFSTGARGEHAGGERAERCRSGRERGGERSVEAVAERRSAARRGAAGWLAERTARTDPMPKSRRG